MEEEAKTCDDIEYWKIPKFEDDENLHPVIEQSTFRILFPKYRELYFKTNWNNIKNELDNHSVECDIDYIEGAIVVKTTEHMWDPYIIIKARDMIKLICRSVPLEQAKKILNDDVFCEIIPLNINRLNKKRFVKRRARLIGPEGNTIKALEILCQCSIHIQGNTASVVGSLKAIKDVKKVVDETMSNIHPVYNIKALMVKHELSQNDEMRENDWKAYVPKYKSKHIRTKHKKFKKRDTTALPPLPVPSKIDKELESGEYFLKKHEKRAKAIEKRNEIQQKNIDKRRKEKEAVYIPPKERSFPQPNNETSLSIKKIKNNLSKKTNIP